jgi:hypothetical protein
MLASIGLNTGYDMKKNYFYFLSGLLLMTLSCGGKPKLSDDDVKSLKAEMDKALAVSKSYIPILQENANKAKPILEAEYENEQDATKKQELKAELDILNIALAMKAEYAEKHIDALPKIKEHCNKEEVKNIEAMTHCGIVLGETVKDNKLANSNDRLSFMAEVQKLLTCIANAGKISEECENSYTKQ